MLMDNEKKWFVMRDLKRPNAKILNWEILSDKGFEVYTPLKTIIENKGISKKRRYVPIIRDLLFVNSTRNELDPIVIHSATLQYRYYKGHGWEDPMVVPSKEMTFFMEAIKASASTKYFMPEEVTPNMIGKKIRIIGGPLNGFEGILLKIMGSSVKRLLIELPGIVFAAVEVSPNFIEYLK